VAEKFLAKRIQEQRERDTSGPVISLRLSSKDDRHATEIAKELGITRPQLAKAALLAAIDGYRQESGREPES
jgi:hypothetical protein